jgi:glyoxylase-like metal-dependent hydrolase (beta-lactamase superfamily II)
MVDTSPPAPVVNTDNLIEIANGVYVIPDSGVPLVPNIGIIGGKNAILVVDTGMGPDNATRVFECVTELAGGRKIFLTTTHFHPEHSFGSAVFAPHATILMNQAQLTDIQNKASGYLNFFRTFGESVAKELEGVEFVAPDIVYPSSYQLDLGVRVVEFLATGQAHTLGDQVIRVPDVGAVFCGDLVEESQFSIFPWFPPEDVDVSGIRWIKVMEGLMRSGDTLVIPGHGKVSGKGLLEEVHSYLSFLKHEVWTRRAAGFNEEEISSEVLVLARGLHPKWVGEEWIEKGVQCFCFEHSKSEV